MDMAVFRRRQLVAHRLSVARRQGIDNLTLIEEYNAMSAKLWLPTPKLVQCLNGLNFCTGGEDSPCRDTLGR